MNNTNTYNELLLKLRRLISPSLAEDEPNLPITKAEGPYFFGVDGKRYLDFVCGMATTNIGHCHPKVIEAAKKQMDKLIHGPAGVVLYEVMVQLAEELEKIMPGNIDMFFFLNSGSEAVEGAVKMARYITGRPGIVSFVGGFHGRSMGAASLTTSKGKYRYHYEPLLPSVYFAPYAYCYRCPYDKKFEDCKLACLNGIETIFSHLISPKEIAAFVLEPIQGEGGYIVPPDIWLKEIRRICDRYGIMLIFDEVQTGFGRTGEWFASQTFGVVPDIMAIAKGIASGFPLSAVASNHELMLKWTAGSHGTTFGGNPVSCAAALATLSVFREENVIKNVQIQGEYALNYLKKLQGQTGIIGDVRGRGLMIGIEFVTPDLNNKPNPDAVKQILKRSLDNGLVLYPCGLENNTIRFIPPLNISRDILDEGLSILAEAILAI